VKLIEQHDVDGRGLRALPLIPVYPLHRLQTAPNAAARLVTGLPRSAHISFGRCSIGSAEYGPFLRRFGSFRPKNAVAEAADRQ